MTIHLPQELEHYVKEIVLSGRFASEEEAIVEAVRLLRNKESAQPQASTGEVLSSESPTNLKPIWKQVLDTMNDVPDDVFEHIPSDGSEQHDHYIYGRPKRSNP
jgi:putative addiction module CopG family antidote